MGSYYNKNEIVLKNPFKKEIAIKQDQNFITIHENKGNKTRILKKEIFSIKRNFYQATKDFIDNRETTDFVYLTLVFINNNIYYFTNDNVFFEPRIGFWEILKFMLSNKKKQNEIAVREYNPNEKINENIDKDLNELEGLFNQGFFVFDGKNRTRGKNTRKHC